MQEQKLQHLCDPHQLKRSSFVEKSFEVAKSCTDLIIKSSPHRSGIERGRSDAEIRASFLAKVLQVYNEWEQQ